MDPSKAAPLNNAIALTRHPRLDYRTAEAGRYVEWLEEYVRAYIRPGCRLVELGCGAGKQTLKCESLGARVVGLDCAGEALHYARAIAAEMGSRAAFVQADYGLSPFAGKSMDLVLFPLNLVECSYAEADRLAGEIRRILKPRGLLILTLKDSLLQYSREGAALPVYDPLTGLMAGKTELPDGQQFEYPCYFWTCAYAAHVFSRFLQTEVVQPILGDRFLLVFRKTG